MKCTPALLPLVPVFLLLLVLPTSGPAQASEGQDLSAHPLRVCACESSFIHPTDTEGAAAGLEADLLRGFAESLDRHLEVIWLSPCQDHDVHLGQGHCEVAATRMTWTEERAARFALSAGYLPVRMVLVTRAEQVDSGAGPMKVAALADTLNSRAADELPNAETVPLHDEADMFRRVADGEVDALVCDTAVVLDYIADYPGLAVSRFLDEGSHYSFALAPNSSLLEPLDAHLAEVKADGSYEELLVKHFGRDLAATLTERDE